MRGAPGVVMMMALWAAPAAAQRAPLELEARAGVIASTPLVRDEVAAGAGAPAVRARIGPSPFLGVAVRRAIGERDGVELSGGWTFGALEVDDAGAWREAEPVGVLHGALLYRRAIHERWALRGGVGGVRYGRTDAELLRSSTLRALIEAGAEARFDAGGVRLGVGAFAQAHGFGTTAMREAGGLDGSVIRFGASVGALLGGER